MTNGICNIQQQVHKPYSFLVRLNILIFVYVNLLSGWCGKPYYDVMM